MKNYFNRDIQSTKNPEGDCAGFIVNVTLFLLVGGPGRARLGGWRWRPRAAPSELPAAAVTRSPPA
eukprot:scaffold393966_cov34-Prasinocladus_malaysianus.AAC.1